MFAHVLSALEAAAGQDLHPLRPREAMRFIQVLAQAAAEDPDLVEKIWRLEITHGGIEATRKAVEILRSRTS